MCHLFGLSAAPRRIDATFWPLDTPERDWAATGRYPDGAGIGTFSTDGACRVEKQPIDAAAGRAFAHQPRAARSATFVAHIRHASTGRVSRANTHPFCQDGRILAHNGVIEELSALDERLGPARALVSGETDSERLFALITREIGEHGGDVAAGITAATRWIAGHLPLYSINFILTTPTELWALRYPDTNRLHVLRRPPGGRYGRHLDHSSAFSEIRIRSMDLLEAPAVVVESELMDEDPRWREMEPGELLHVGPDLSVRSELVLTEPPARPLSLADLRPRAAASQVANVAAEPPGQPGQPGTAPVASTAANTAANTT